jgi:hypothetical protein
VTSEKRCDARASLLTKAITIFLLPVVVVGLPLPRSAIPPSRSNHRRGRKAKGPLLHALRRGNQTLPCPFSFSSVPAARVRPLTRRTHQSSLLVEIQPPAPRTLPPSLCRILRRLPPPLPPSIRWTAELDWRSIRTWIDLVCDPSRESRVSMLRALP